MLVSQQSAFRKFWHAVMPMSELSSGPKPFTLLGQKIVLFLDADIFITDLNLLSHMVEVTKNNDYHLSNHIL